MPFAKATIVYRQDSLLKPGENRVFDVAHPGVLTIVLSPEDFAEVRRSAEGQTFNTLEVRFEED